MHRSVLLLALMCAMFSITAQAHVQRHKPTHSRVHDARVRPTHALAGRRHSVALSRHGGVSARLARRGIASFDRQPVRRHTVRVATTCRHGRHCAASRNAALTLQHRTPRATLRTVRLKPVDFPLPPPMKGSRESLLRQNVRADQDGLTRIEDDAELAGMLRSRQLVSLPVNNGLTVDSRLPANRRYCREWTANFLADMARAHYSRFGAPLQVNSAVRTVAYQRHLLGINGNAAPAEGDNASPHLTGATIDIGKRGWTTSQIGWMRAYLLPLESRGRIDVEEEFQQSCFHITVYKSYATELEASTPKHALLAARVR